MSLSAMDLAWVQAQFPDLTNLQSLAEGGQKIVLSADHPTDGPIVLKLIHSSHGIPTVEREILAVQAIDCRRVPAIHGFGRVASPVGDLFWFREQRISGQTVRDALTSGPFSPEAVLRLGVQCLEALVRAETQHIVHRDVKPENIIRAKNGDYWLLDFGIARHLQLSPLTRASSRFGKFTPGYAPREQFRNIQTEIDSRADLFGLGVTMYECAIGSNPFREGAQDDLEVLRRVETLVFPSLNLAIAASGEVRDFVAALTQKRRDHRPATAASALDWLQDICDHLGFKCKGASSEGRTEVK